MSTSSTRRAGITLTVKEYAVVEGQEARPWLMLEFYDQIEPGIDGRGGFLGFDFREATTVREAEEFCRLFNDRISEIAHTKHLQ